MPARKYFYSSTKNGKIVDDGKISDVHISVKDYLTCEKIWDKFKMKNMGVYHDHYLKKDVMLSADVFEKVISTCVKFYGLDPCHYFSSPGLSWDTMLKMTGVKFEKISDIDKYLFMEKGLRGGFLTLLRDTLKQIINTWMIMTLKNRQHLYHYLDMNNLYGWAMSIFLMVCSSG